MIIEVIDGEKIYNFTYAGDFWFGAAVLSTLLTLLVWNAKAKD